MNLQQCARWFFTATALLAGSLCVNTASAVAIITEMDVLPHNGTPAWGTVGDLPLATVGEGILRINDTSTSDFLRYSQYLNTQDTTLEARVKVASSVPNGTGVAAYMSLADADNYGVFLDLQPDKVTLFERFTTWDVIDTHVADMTTDFRTLRMMQDETTTKVYLDGAEIFSYAQQDLFSTHVAFGSLTMSGQSDAYWDYVAFTGEGAFDPERVEFDIDGNGQGDEGNGGQGGEGNADASGRGAVSNGTANPEPTSALLLVLGAVLCGARRRRKHAQP